MRAVDGMRTRPPRINRFWRSQARRASGGSGVKIHEYQGKAVLASFGVPVPKGKVAYTAAEAVEIGKELGFPVVVKAQIHAGGRGKGGGVKLARSAEDCEALAKVMLGMTLVTHQTGPEGRVVRRLLIEQGMDLEGAREMYLAIVVDRASGKPVFMASSQGGMDIEEVAAKNPKAILQGDDRAGRGLPGLPGPQAGLRPRASGPRCCPRPWPSCRRCTGPSRAPTPRSSRSTRSCRRGPASSSPSTPSSTSTTTPSIATRTSRSSATSTRRTPSRSRPRSSR